MSDAPKPTGIFPAETMLPGPAELAEAWSRVIGNALELGRSVTEAATRPSRPLPFDPASPVRALGEFAGHIMTDPAALMQAQAKAAAEWFALIGAAATRAAGGSAKPVIAPERGDRRFADPAWSNEPAFDLLKQAYLLASRQALDLVRGAEGLDEGARTRAEFFTQSYLNALSPANFAFTNPQAIRRALETGSLSLVSGLANMLADAAAQPGIVQRRTGRDFELGVDLAATPGSVIFQNELMQLIQYTPATDEVYRTPILYVPPLVNKYYLLDLQPKSSLIRWLVERGHSVFVISWVNPGAGFADRGIADYIQQGPVAALDAIAQATGETCAHLFGFCMGGTLTGIAAAWLAGQGQGERVASLTAIGSLFDFAELGQWTTFREPEQIEAMERHLEATGLLSAVDLQALFSAVRANDLIWSSVVNHYLLDQEAPASDILHWFADGAHIPRAFLLEWARDVLRDNKLPAGGLKLGGSAIDLGKVKAPLLAISLKDDHVSAWTATYDGARKFGGPVTFLLGGSGHNAGVINPPSANKHGFWTNDQLPDSAQEWFDGAARREGSWWPTWHQWLARQSEGKAPARVPGSGKLLAIEPAPGSYVRVRG